MTRKRKTALAAGVLAAAMLLGGCSGGDGVDTAQGVAYLEALEQQDPDAVDQILRQRRLEQLEREREELLRQIKAGEQDPFPLFQDAAILGDSRAVGFFYYGFVDESRDLTGSGETILDIPRKLDTLQAMNPRYVYLTYGLNDIKIGHWGSLQAHISEYLDRVQEIRERLPEAVIVISSVLPYHDPNARTDATGETTPSSASSLTEADRKRLAQIPEWNRLMADAAREHGVIFVDNSAICTEYENLWEKDGIHVFKSFYPHWGKNLIVAALEEGGIADESASA
ncbi:MAG: SGNH/GDSL hydrolase family protein [Oscillospiraceae bacterium]|nr:SGNH/GDSL hydrolase family protein [Oscillospiraceae bacterium]